MIRCVSSLRKRLPLSLRTSYGWLKRRCRPHPVWDDEEYRRTYEWLQRTQWWSLAELEELQLAELQALVRYAYDHVPYYHHLFREQHLIPTDIRSLDDLVKIPLLTKRQVQEHFHDLCAPDKRTVSEYVTTSGSTGLPLGLLHERYTAHVHECAYMQRQWSWAGYQPEDRIATLRGNAITHRLPGGEPAWWDYNTDNNELVLSSREMSEENLGLYAEMLQSFKPQFINAYPSSLEVLARYMRRNNMRYTGARAAFLESETLYAWQRSMIEEQFACDIFAGYGQSERVVDAVECEHHQGYHVSMEYGILELVDHDGTPIKAPDALGLVVGTGFDNACMPLIRYVTDDLASYAAQPCRCGRQSPLIADFSGRLREFIVPRNGRLIPLMVVFAGHADVWTQIRELRFVQAKEGELTVQVARARGSSETEVAESLRREVFKRLDEQDFRLHIEFVDSVRRSARGKLGLLDQQLPIRPEDLESVLSEVVDIQATA
ncbi:MAG: phenylacetate--CoA ligase family protein [Anaerolineae bacterium]